MAVGDFVLTFVMVFSFGFVIGNLFMLAVYGREE
jgi:hypothetical protein